MPSYSEFVTRCHLVTQLEFDFTGGDVDYNGTVLEVNDADGGELFHILVDENTGEKQILIFGSPNHWRISLDHLREAIKHAEGWVRVVPSVEEQDFD